MTFKRKRLAQGTIDESIRQELVSLTGKHMTRHNTQPRRMVEILRDVADYIEHRQNRAEKVGVGHDIRRLADNQSELDLVSVRPPRMFLK